MFRMPGGDALLPLLPRQIVLIHDSEMKIKQRKNEYTQRNEKIKGGRKKKNENKINWIIFECEWVGRLRIGKVGERYSTVAEGDGRWPGNRKSAIPYRDRRIWPERHTRRVEPTFRAGNKCRPSRWHS